jgi:hypothetical protein
MLTNVYGNQKNPFFNKSRSDACYQSVQDSIREKRVLASTIIPKIKVEPIPANMSVFMYYVLFTHQPKKMIL